MHVSEPARFAPSRRRSRFTPRRIAGKALIYLALLVGLMIMLTPFAYMVGISFMPSVYILGTPPIFIPPHPTFDNYIQAWNGNSFGQAFFNSVTVASVATAINVALAASLAFAFARYRFPGRTVLYYTMLATMTVPSLVLIIPQFVLASHLHLTNSRIGLILVYAAGMAFSVFLLRSFFEELPQELMDAASIDGCGVWRTFFRIALPLARPALAAAIIFSFLGNWDEFTWAITSLNDQSLYTLPIAIQQFQSAHTTQWGIVFAASTIAVLPVMIVFLIFQRHFIRGVSAGAVKG
ncbi:MAG TPA: carbohydrate ABC transporter permease [Chloroflexota bacterium]|nr:carbohydrate ABC transporter permease [Chloroflexota bacterium]